MDTITAEAPVGAGPGRWKTLALVPLSFLLALLLAEVGLRLLDVSYYWAVARRVHPHTGWAPPPSVSAWQTIEGRARVEINRAGMRDRDHPLEPPPNTLRIAVLGDSFAEAVQVPVDETFWARMGQDLRGCGALRGRAVEVLNFAVSGYSTAQALLTYRHRVRPFRPDLVLLAFFAGNDLTENRRSLDGDLLRPYFTLREGRLVPDTGFRDSVEYQRGTSLAGRIEDWLIEHLRLVQMALRARDVWRLWRGEGPVAPTASELDEPGVDERVYRLPTEPEWEEAWAVTEEIIGQLAREARADGASFVLASASTGAQVHPDPAFREAFMRAHGIEDLLYPERRVAAYARQEGFLAVPLAGELQYLAMLSGAWLHGFPNSLPGVGHWNATGHRLAGELLANSLCREWPRIGASIGP
jgi:hypothetical protein